MRINVDSWDAHLVIYFSPSCFLLPYWQCLNFSAEHLLRRSPACPVLSVTTAGGNIFRYSKWNLNQEVKKTTKKNKLDKIPRLGYFEVDLRLAAARLFGVWIEKTKHIYGERKSMILWKGRRHIGSCPVRRCVLVASLGCARFWRRCTPDLKRSLELKHSPWR